MYTERAKILIVRVRAVQHVVLCSLPRRRTARQNCKRISPAAVAAAASSVEE